MQDSSPFVIEKVQQTLGINPFTFNLLMYLTLIMKELIVSFSEAIPLSSTEKSIHVLYISDRTK